MSLTTRKVLELAALTAGWIVVGAARSWRERTVSRIVESVRDGRMSLDQARLARKPLKWALPIWGVGMALITLYWALGAFG